jgi:hypothetical protein
MFPTCLWSQGAEISFDHVILDNEGPKDPWAKITGDIDGDGFADVVVGGRKGPLVWYSYPTWSKAIIAEGGYQTVDGELGDMDADGDLDVVMGGLIWYENPRPDVEPTRSVWKAHKVADHPTHDVELADLDCDGDMDIVTRDQSEFGHKAGNRIHIWRQDPGDKWTEKILNCPHGEAITVADIDKDDDPDIVIGGIWFENDRNIVEGTWNGHQFGKWHPSATVQIADINGDARPDIILSPSELKNQFYKLSWFEAPSDPKKNNWTEHIIVEPIECVIHGLVTADINGDGMIDVVSSEMHQGTDPDEVVVFINRNNGASWDRQVISSKGSHYIRVADIGNDGDMDIFGANWSGPYQPIELWENKSADRQKGKAFESKDVSLDKRFKYCLPFQVGAGGVERMDRPVEVDLNTEVKRLHVVEVAQDGKIVDDSVVFQFDKASPDDAGGELTFMLKGITPAEGTRFFHVYFGGPRDMPGPEFERFVTYIDDIRHEGQGSIKIVAKKATYYYHKLGAGFASLEDCDGNDWLSYNPGVGQESQSGSGGKYRGTPNMGHPEGYCHPGNSMSDTRILSAGPIKVTLESLSNDSKMHCRWDIFPHYARMTVLKMRLPYWFLYEGTPGGKLDMRTDQCIRVHGKDCIITGVDQKWQGDLQADEGLEWLAFADPHAVRSLYIVNHRDDEAVDSYWPMNQEMTVFGFGRLGINKYMRSIPAHFTIGLVDSVEVDQIQAGINNACQPLSINIGSVEVLE